MKKPCRSASKYLNDELVPLERVHTALCIWEWLLARHSGGDAHITAMFADCGYVCMRFSSVIAAEVVDNCWYYMGTNHIQLPDLEVFDWEFVPVVCSLLDWTGIAANQQYGSDLPVHDPKEIMAKLLAMKALNVD